MGKETIKNKVFSGIIWKFGERISAQLVSLIVSIILARLLSPEDYGSVSIVMVFITILNVFVSNGLGNALIQKKDIDNLDFSSVFYINVFLGIFLYFILFCLAPVIADFYNMEILKWGLRVLGIRIVMASINSVQQAYVSRNMLFKRFFWSTLTGTMVSGIVGIILAYNGAGVWALIVQYLTNTCTDTVVLWFTVRWRPEFKCSFNRAKSLISFGWKLLVSGLLDTGYRQLRSLVIGKKYTSSDLAYYNQGEKYPSLIVTNVNTSISSVLFPALSKYQDDAIHIKQMTRNAIQISAFVMWPIMVAMCVVAEPMIRLLLTEKWLPCVPYLRIFCFSYGLWPIHTANLQAINALGRSDLFLKLELVKKAFGLICLLAVVHISPLAIACSLIIADILSVFINAAPNIRLLDYQLSEQLSDLLSPLALCIPSAIIAYLIGCALLPDIVKILLQILVGGVIYLAVSKIMKFRTLDYLSNILVQKIKK